MDCLCISHSGNYRKLVGDNQFQGVVNDITHGRHMTCNIKWCSFNIFSKIAAITAMSGEVCFLCEADVGQGTNKTKRKLLHGSCTC